MNLEDKYPEAYFDHYMAMFNGALSNEALRSHISLAESMEGLEYLEGLLAELKMMKQYGDQEAFMNLAIAHEVRGFEEQHLQFLFDELAARTSE